MMNIKILSKKLVKPCLPTPPHLKPYNLSFLDEFLPLTEVGVLLFYESRRDEEIDLEESLARVLVQFYPLAGRLALQDQIVDCNDEGAEFVEAEAPDVDLASLIVERDLENLYGFLPRKHGRFKVDTYPILSIQVTGLKSGGLVIGISVSHKIFDAASLATFLAAWTNASNPEGKAVVFPDFNSSSVFPGKRLRKSSNVDIHNTDTTGISVKRFTFNREAITRCKSGLGFNEGGERVSRVRVVCALISRALIGVDRAKQGKSRDFLVNVAVSMRERTSPPLHKHACGNLVLLSVGRCPGHAEVVGIRELVDLIGDATRSTIRDCSGMLSAGEEGRNDVILSPLRVVSSTFSSGEAGVASFSDYSKFGFNEADFGWGKPAWTSIAPQPGRNIIVLMGDMEGDGIEAWVHLEKGDMCLFEQEMMKLDCLPHY